MVHPTPDGSTDLCEAPGPEADPVPLLRGGKARESCSKAVARFPKGSYRGDVPWLRSPPPCPAFTRDGGLGAKAAPRSYAGDGAKSFPRRVKCLGGAAASLPLLRTLHRPSPVQLPGPTKSPIRPQCPVSCGHPKQLSREVHARWMRLPQPPRSHIFPAPYGVWGCSSRWRMPEGL